MSPKSTYLIYKLSCLFVEVLKPRSCLSVYLSRSWNPDLVCPSICQGLETQILFVRLSVKVLKPRSCLSVYLSRSWNPDRGLVRLSVSVHMCGGFYPSVRGSVRGLLVCLFCDGGYIFVGEGPGIRNCNKAGCGSSRVSRLIFTSNYLEPDSSLKFFHPPKLEALF
jgi:hypothetical protein